MFKNMIITNLVWWDTRTQTKMVDGYPVKSRCEVTIDTKVIEPRSVFAKYIREEVEHIQQTYGNDVEISPNYKIFDDQYFVGFVAIHNIPGNSFRKWYRCSEWIADYKEHTA